MTWSVNRQKKVKNAFSSLSVSSCFFIRPAVYLINDQSGPRKAANLHVWEAGSRKLQVNFAGKIN